jgi:hypothetical protein
MPRLSGLRLIRQQKSSTDNVRQSHRRGFVRPREDFVPWRTCSTNARMAAILLAGILLNPGEA